MHVEIAYSSLAGKAYLVTIELPEKATIKDALEAAPFLEAHPEILKSEVGVFSHKGTHETVLKEGDRVEIYRPLLIHPMDKRRLLAEKRKGKK
jgi:hypothetical protein